MKKQENDMSKREDIEMIKWSFKQYGIERTEDLLRDSDNPSRRIAQLLDLYKEIIHKALWEVK
jgi:hypothetical protein